MMRWRSAGWLVALAAGVSLAAGQDIAPIGKPAPEFPTAGDTKGRGRDDQIKMFNVQKKLAGRVVMFYFWRTTDTYSIDLFPKVHELLKKYRSRGFDVIAMSPDNHERVDKLFDDGTVEPIPSPSKESDPRNFYGTAYKATQMAYGAMTHPYIVIVDPWGRIFWRGRPPKDLDSFIGRILDELNPHGGDERWLDRRLREAETLLAQGELGKAYSKAKLVADMTDVGNERHNKATTLMDQIEGKAEKWLSEAVQLEHDGQREQAARIVAEISVRIADTEIARKAENEIGRMRGDRRMKEAIRKALDEVRAELELEKARLLADDGLYEEAIELYRKIVKDYKKTRAASLARAEQKKLLSDPAMQKKIAASRARAQAWRWLDIAQRYEQLGMLEQARVYYQKIVDEHPDTPAADDARQRLAALPRPAKLPIGPDTP